MRRVIDIGKDGAIVDASTSLPIILTMSTLDEQLKEAAPVAPAGSEVTEADVVQAVEADPEVKKAMEELKKLDQAA